MEFQPAEEKVSSNREWEFLILKTRSEPDPENQDQNLILKTRNSGAKFPDPKNPYTYLDI